MNHSILTSDPLRLALCAACLPLGITYAHAQECLRPVYPNPMYKVGDFPTLIESADINNDGHADILTYNHVSGSVSVLHGEGRGAFAPQYEFFAGNDIVSMHIADIDDDGDQDLIALSQQNMQVNVFKNPGDGQFSNRVTYPITSEFEQLDLYSMTVSDFDDDGDVDVVVPIRDISETSVLWNNGNGQFVAEFDYAPVPLSTTKYLDRIDIDLDGDLDYLELGGNEICVHLNNGDGTYELPSCFNSTPAVRLLVQDLNADGFPDVVGVSGPFDVFGECTVSINDGMGGFLSQESYQFPDMLTGVTLGDVDRDGIPDLVVGIRDERNRSELVVLVNDGLGVFENDEPIIEGEFDVGDTQLVDIDADGNLDLLYTRPLRNLAAVLMGSSGGGFVFPEQSNLEVRSTLLIITDMDQDGDADVIGAASSNIGISISKSLGDGSFTDPVIIPARQRSGVADIDQDGDMDLLIMVELTDPPAESSHAVLLNNGDATFADPLPIDLGGFHRNIDLIDYDNDGVLDILIYSTNSVRWYRGGGDGTFLDEEMMHEIDELETLEDYFEMYPGDFDQDGDMDFVLVGSLDYTSDLLYLTRLKNNGDGSFTETSPISLGVGFEGAEIRDLDMDGDLDVIIICPRSDDAHVLLNDGTGQFSIDRFFTGDSHGYYQLVDYDVDGDPDLITSSDGFPPDMTIHINDGEACFDRKEYYAPSHQEVGSGPYHVGDFDANGKPDILGDVGQDTLILFDQCRDGFSCPADLNGDGMIDFFDVSAFLVAFAAEDPIADFNNDGMFNFFDVGPFLVEFNAGCP